MKFAYPEVSLLGVLLPADFAGERFLAGVGDQMPLHRGDANEPLAANAADRKDLGGTLAST